jgi:hypothetical protein
MNKHEQQEAERIAGELAKADAEFRRTGQAGIDAHSLETMTLAKAVQLFSGRLEADPLNAEQRAINAFTEAL